MVSALIAAALVNRFQSDNAVISFFLFFNGGYFWFAKIPSENVEEISHVAVVGTLIWTDTGKSAPSPSLYWNGRVPFGGPVALIGSSLMTPEVKFVGVTTNTCEGVPSQSRSSWLLDHLNGRSYCLLYFCCPSLLCLRLRTTTVIGSIWAFKS